MSKKQVNTWRSLHNDCCTAIRDRNLFEVFSFLEGDGYSASQNNVITQMTDQCQVQQM